MLQNLRAHARIAVYGMISQYNLEQPEEYDETYAQAFGVQPGCPWHDLVNGSEQPVKAPPLASLSGPLVIAETLGGGTSATKHTKAKENSKKDRYLFKRQDESSNLKAHQTRQGQAGSSAASAHVEGSVAAADGNYVLQKRASAVSVKPQVLRRLEQAGLIGMTGADSSHMVENP